MQILDFKELGNFQIDSLKLSIKVEDLKAVNIDEKQYLINETGEVLSEFKNHSLTLDYNDTKIYYSILDLRESAVSIYRFVILISSKIKREHYFEGIQKNDIQLIFEILKINNIIDYDNWNYIYENLYISDIDIKQDFYTPISQSELLKTTLKQMMSEFSFSFTPKMNIGTGYRAIYTDKNAGFQFNNRKSSTIKFPFFKMYHKTKQMKYSAKHKDFFTKLALEFPYIMDLFQKYEIIRFEFTLKNKTHLEKYKLTNKLSEFLREINFNNYRFNEILIDFLNRNLNIKKSIFKDIKELTPTEILLKRLLDYSDINYLTAFNLFKADFSKQQAYRNAKLLKKLFELEISKENDKLINRRLIHNSINYDKIFKIFRKKYKHYYFILDKKKYGLNDRPYK